MMTVLENLRWKVKYKLLWISLVLSGYLQYEFVIDPLINYKRKFDFLQSSELISSDQSHILESLKLDLQKTNYPWRNRDTTSVLSFQKQSEIESLLYFAEKHHIALRVLPNALLLDMDPYPLAYMEYQFQGDFFNLIRFLKDIESQVSGTHFTSCSFIKKSNSSKKLDELILSVRTLKIKI